jgi:hypothetical protein
MKTIHRIVAQIDRDYINSDGAVGTRIGLRWFNKEIDALEGLPIEQTRFRLLDDDHITYYGGWLLNDDECLVQSTLLEWGMYDAGCTIIEVKDENGEWVQEIG